MLQMFISISGIDCKLIKIKFLAERQICSECEPQSFGQVRHQFSIRENRFGIWNI